MSSREPTGSVKLGRELRRRRGPRSLEQVARLSRRLAASRGCQSLSASTLSRLERGQRVPSPHHLRSLQHLYQFAADELLDFITEEELIRGIRLPGTLARAATACEAAFAKEEWRAALALAGQAEHLAEEPSERLRWRATRATALHMCGMPRTALLILADCVDDPHVQTRLFKVLRALAEVEVSLGHFKRAAQTSLWAQQEAPEPLPPTWKWLLADTRCRILLVGAEITEALNGETSRLALSELKDAQQALGEDERSSVWTELRSATAFKLLGEHAKAARMLSGLIRSGRLAGMKHAEFTALLNLGVVRRNEGKLDASLKALRSAETIASGEKLAEECFDAYFELYRLSLLRQDGQAQGYLDRCAAIHASVQARTPAVLAYERIIATRSHR